MEKKTFSKQELQEMVAQLESEFHKIMKSEQEFAQPLAKSEEEAKEKEEEKKEDEKKEEPKAEAKEESKEEPKAEAKEEEKKDEESHGYDEEDMEEMQKMYASMSKAERMAHKSAIEKCGEMSQMAKSEEAQEIFSEKTVLLKSEIESVKKENEELKKNIEGLVAAMNTFVTKRAPARKAITEIEFVKKSEDGNEEKPLSKAEIDQILAKKVVDPSLTRADREAINSFYLTNAGVEKIKHLLKQ